MSKTERILSLDREEMSLTERKLCLNDVKKVLKEYFELCDDESMELTRTDEGFLICVLFTARRIKALKPLE